jgi:DNA (cytosine-5)-methyltransferase 1
MFSGIGGFEYGIQQASSNRTLGDRQQPTTTADIRQDGDSANSTSSVGNGRWELPECVGYSEIDKYAIKVYERNFNGHKNYGDATKINPEELPDFDLLVGGFPCQAFSIAGKRRGFDDTRGTLFFDIARILAEKKPKHLVLENVKGLLSHDQGRTFQTILGVLSDLGYSVEWQVLNSKDFGVPQNRERVIIVGYLGGEPRRKVFPITGTNSQDIVQLNQPKHSNDRVYSEEGLSPTLNTMQGGRRQPLVAPVLTPNRIEKRQNGRRIKNDGEPSFTLTGQDIHGVQIDTRIRRLTPLECERLQGFPDNWTALGVGDEPISDTQRYKMCGNAVTTNVIQAVMEKLL